MVLLLVRSLITVLTYLLASIFITARSSYASAVLGIVILFVCPSNSVFLSVTRVLCDETIEHTVDISIPRERVINLVF